MRADIEEHSVSVPVQHGNLKVLRRLFAQNATHCFIAYGSVLRGDEALDIPMQNLIARPANHLLGWSIHRGDSAFQIQSEQDVFGVFEKIVESPFPMSDRVFRTIPFDDVPQDTQQQFLA